ncbi:MAG: glycosyltransferase family 2 protein [Paracoccus sp. (in: a-proteobacteria)]
MTVQTLRSYLASRPAELAAGPVAIVLCEDDTEIDSTLAHARKSGFRNILALSPEPLAEFETLPGQRNLIFDARRSDAHVTAVNAVNDAVPAGTWVHYCYNAEYLFFPFSETRRVGEMLTFHTEERRPAMLTYVVDLYARDLNRFPNAVSLEEAMFDGSGYFALGRTDADGNYLEQQKNFHGGLRWRFEEYLPESRRRIDRISLFRTKPGLRLLDDHRFNDEEYNTYSCPWHHNLTASVASFRVAKALVKNPRSRNEITSFTWRNSHAFRWKAQQLMDLGLMEPGQWF